ncbi:MAG: diaminopimelate epimerase, partial [Sedimentisphaerales bacterium]
MKFYKYQALGNDYIVLNPDDFAAKITKEQVRRICHRNYGLGSDGILYGPTIVKDADFALRIFNPDGSEAEKSGNGLRIFSRYLFDMKKAGTKPFTISTPGGIVKSQILQNGRKVTVEMGRASFDSIKIPVTGPQREVINEEMKIDGQLIKFSAVTIGNPHCVV